MAKRYKTQRRVRVKRSRLKKIAGNRLFWIGVAGCVVFVGIGYAIFFTPFFEIKHIEIQGNQKVATENIRKFIEERLPKQFVFFQINHLFLADAKSVGKELQEAYLEIELVTMSKTFPNKVKVVVKERQGVALWCQSRSYTIEVEDEEGETRSFRQCFALDSNGIIFPAESPEGIQAGPPQSSGAGLGGEVVIYGGKENAVVGDQVIKSELLILILAFQNELDSSVLFQDVGLHVSSFFIVSEARMNAKISEGWEVYVNPQEDMNWQVTKVKLVLQEEVSPDRRSTLQYIDLRFGDQAYIKYY